MREWARSGGDPVAREDGLGRALTGWLCRAWSRRPRRSQPLWQTLTLLAILFHHSNLLRMRFGKQRPSWRLAGSGLVPPRLSERALPRSHLSR